MRRKGPGAHGNITWEAAPGAHGNHTSHTGISGPFALCYFEATRPAYAILRPSARPVYATVGNLFCLNSYSGIDPDVNTNLNAGGDGFPTPYYDYNSYPQARSFTFGLNVSF